MTIKFKYDGIEFEVATAKEVGQVMRELQRHRPRAPRRVQQSFPVLVPRSASTAVSSSAASSFSKIFPGITVGSSATESMKSKAMPSVRMAESPVYNYGIPDYVTDAGRDVMTPNDGVTVTFELLTAIRKAGTRGLTADEVAKILKVKHPKGVGPRSLMVNNTLAQLGFVHDQVYNNDRTAQGRIWTAREKLNDALETLEAATKGVLALQAL